ncbi:MAG: outer membrane protein assembly factor BamA [Halocynthiibacter sp.]
MNALLAGCSAGGCRAKALLQAISIAIFVMVSAVSMLVPQAAQAQQYRFTSVEIIGNQRIEDATILTYAGIARGQTLTAGELNEAYQRILDSGLFESVEVDPQGSRLVIRVQEFPTISRINIEGNRRIKDEDLLPILQSQPRRVFSPTIAEADAAEITEAYSQQGRLATTVDARIIRRSDNRVDLVFAVKEGRVSEIDRPSLVGNRAYSDRRLRRVLETKQAGLLRALIRSDTFIADRIEFDKQVLRDFYLSRGYIDIEVLSVNSELTRGRDAFFVTFNLREGQQFRFGELSTSSDLEEVDIDDFQDVIRVNSGDVYSPTLVENTIARLERLALRKSLNFIRVEPRVTRNDRDLTLDVEFIITRGPRVFVERIDIEGNTTTLDRVVRDQFRVVEGDPFNPRQIREAAERIRALGFFGRADVSSREGTTPQQVVVGVNVEEVPTGSLSFGASYSVENSVGFTIAFSERNFLGRGQRINLSLNTSPDTASGLFSFTEPNLLGRDLALGFAIGYQTSENSNSFYSTRIVSFSPSLAFPVSENGRLSVNYRISEDTIFAVDPDSSAILILEAAADGLIRSSIGYSYSYDTRRTGLNPNAGIVFRFGQDFGGIGGDVEYIRSTALLGAETKVWNEEVTLRAVLEGGAVSMLSGDSRVTDRFFMSSGQLRGFQSNGVGPRDLGAVNEDALGGNFFASARFEADFPFGLPEEYGISGGVFLDIGSVWSLDNVAGTGGTVDDSFNLRSAIGFSVFWDTAIGPLRFNFSRALKKEAYDQEQTFDLTISTTF